MSRFCRFVVASASGQIRAVDEGQSAYTEGMLHCVAEDEFPASEAAPPRRVPGRPFKPGQSGNPGGKPRRAVDGQSLPELARAHTGDALRALAGILSNPKELTVNKIAAANVILQRGWGDAPPVVQGGGEFRVVIEQVTADPNAPRAPGILRLPTDPASVSRLDIIDAEPRIASPSHDLGHDGPAARDAAWTHPNEGVTP